MSYYVKEVYLYYLKARPLYHTSLLLERWCAECKSKGVDVKWKPRYQSQNQL